MEEINFFALGQKKAEDIYADYNKIAEDIEAVYGSDARLEYECGLSIAMANNSMANVKENVEELMNSRPRVVADNLRNNSYFNREGTSRRFDKAGAYNEPGKRRK